MPNNNKIYLQLQHDEWDTVLKVLSFHTQIDPTKLREIPQAKVTRIMKMLNTQLFKHN